MYKHKRVIKTYLTKENFDKVVNEQLSSGESISKIVGNRINKLKW